MGKVVRTRGTVRIFDSILRGVEFWLYTDKPAWTAISVKAEFAGYTVPNEYASVEVIGRVLEGIVFLEAISIDHLT